MKEGIPAYVGYRVVLFTFIIALSGVVSPIYCQTQDFTLLVQQTPNEGGAVTPVSGVYRFEENAEVKLTATPKPGYEFLYWLGDVSDQQSNSTIVYLDKPKIVVAVFEPVRENFEVGDFSIGGGGGGSAMISNPVTIGSPASISGTGGVKPKSTTVSTDEEPPVIPEPATGILLALGSLLTFTKRPRRKINSDQI